MLLISGLDLILVGRFQFSAVAPFAIASALVGMIQGIQLAVFNATMPHAAALHVRRETGSLGRLVIRNTQSGVLMLLLLGMPLLIYAGPILRAWVGAQYVSQGAVLLNILVAANIIRLVATPYTVALVAAGQQKLVTLSPILEGVTNLIASILLGKKYGATGVAVGTLLGAVVGLLGHVFYNIPRTSTEIAVQTRDFLTIGVGKPVVAVSFLILFAAYSARHGAPNPYVFGTAFVVTVLLSGNLLRKRTTRQNLQVIPQP